MSADAVLIAGPTASGKSAAALALAEKLGGTLINADSMQIYRELLVLTARPSADEEQRVPHLLYGHVGVTEAYSVGRYQADAAAALAEVKASGRLPIFVGGTGLYFAALTEGLAEIPPVPGPVREAVAARREAIGAEAFFAELSARDPEAGARLRPGDTQRTLRAMEVIEATGRPLAYWQQQTGEPVLSGLRLACFVLSPPRAELYVRIDARFEAMLESGALEEARALAGLDARLPAAKILGLRPLQALAAGQMSRSEALAAAQIATRHYAKRQITWFRRRMADWVWLEGVGESNILPEILSHLS
ncbi:MAG: tRNA (adenosine(37)-N6)-dimethylallyltransferase MiaA [Pseudomonadota bacterium]|nr:tRNA (adenosine(37)-N6)-dimethylallyltransferase MiaA [Pseudomonadota bacterium]